MDLDMHQRLKQRLTEEQRKDLLLIQAGGLWTASSLQKAGYLTTGLCPWCGKEEETLQHLWWHCPHHESCRKQLKDRYPRLLQEIPTCLALHGIPPPEPAGDLMGPMWRAVDRDPQTTESEETEDLQGDDRTAWAQVQYNIQQEMAAQRQQPNTALLTLRQTAQWILGEYAPLPAWPQTVAAAVATEQVSTYTDGAVDLGDKLWTGMGTWGVHAPGRLVEELPESLLDIAHVKHHEEGALVYGQSLGPAPPRPAKRR